MAFSCTSIIIIMFSVNVVSRELFWFLFSANSMFRYDATSNVPVLTPSKCRRETCQVPVCCLYFTFQARINFNNTLSRRRYTFTVFEKHTAASFPLGFRRSVGWRHAWRRVVKIKIAAHDRIVNAWTRHRVGQRFPTSGRDPNKIAEV